MSEEFIAVLGVVGTLLGTLLASILPKLIDYHYSEKTEKKKRRIDFITQIKKLSVEGGKTAYLIYDYLVLISKLPEKITITINKDDSSIPNQPSMIELLLFDLNEICLKLLDVSCSVSTYSETRDMEKDINQLDYSLNEYGIMIREKMKSPLNKEVLKEIKAKYDEINKQVAKFTSIHL